LGWESCSEEPERNRARTHAALSLAFYNQDKMAMSEEEARKAIKLNPNLPEAYDILWQIEALKGNLHEAVRNIETEYMLDPLRPGYIQNLGMAYFIEGREDAANQHWERTIGLAPFETNVALTQYNLSKGNLEEAAKTLEVAEKLRPDELLVLFLRGYLEALRGDRDRALKSIARMGAQKFGEDSLQFIGYTHFALGDLGVLFEYLERARELHALDVINLMYHPLFAGIRADPRYEELMHKIRTILWPTNSK
jgi:tetratricopeptide (TPR) repeat protein